MTSRFDAPSAVLELRLLLRKRRSAALASCAVALCVHLALSQVVGFGPEMGIPRPLTTKFVKRAPRLTKPLELKKRARPKRQIMQRQMVSVEAKVSRQGVSSDARSAQALRGLARPAVPIDRSVAAGKAAVTPAVAAVSIGGSREFEQRVDLSLELLDIQALDTGKYHAVVIQDPDDRRNIRGFFHLAIVYPTSITNRSMEWLNMYSVPGLEALARAMNEWTGIRTDLRGRFPFNSRQIFSTPWIYIRYGVNLGSMADTELEILGRYALSGGFVFVDGHLLSMPGYAEYETHRWLILESLKSVGKKRDRDWDFEQIPNSHQLYHCFFDFDGPPIGADEGYGQYVAGYMEAVNIEARMVVVFGHQWYGYAWGNWPHGRNIRQLQLGVNMLVFALTQEGSITNRVMDVVR